MRRRYIAGSKLVSGTITKEKDAVRTLELDYTKLLSRIGSSETISTSTWVEDSGSITIDSESETTTLATVTISGGEHGDKLYLENTIVTNNAETIKKAFCVNIEEVSSNFVANDSYA